MNYNSIVNACVTCLKTFKENITGADSHCEEFLKTVTKDSNCKMFIKQVFYGVLQHKDFLKVFTNKLFEMNKSSTERKDEQLYQIFVYLTLFRLEELSLEEYRRLVLSQDYVKMNEFIKFLFDFNNIETNLLPQWVEIMDYKYVENKLLFNLRKNFELLHDLIENIKLKASGGNISMSNNDTAAFTDRNLNRPKTGIDLKLEENDDFNMETLNTHDRLSKSPEIRKKITIPEPFNLTKPKPKKLSEPMRIEHKLDIKQIPYNLYKKTNLDKIEKDYIEIKKKNKEIVKEKYNENMIFKFKTDERPMNFDKVKDEVEEKIKSELKFNQKYHNPLKDFTNIQANVRYNDTAIIREEYLISKKNMKEQEDLNRILIEKKDDKEFFRWKREKEIQDDLILQEEIKKRKILNKLGKEVALNYNEKKLKENQIKVQNHKKEEELKQIEKEKELKKELEDKKLLCKQVERERENIPLGKKVIEDKNKELFNKQTEEYKDKIAKVKAEKLIEDKKRNDIIKQIRLLESIPIPRTKGFDPTETRDHGLLEQMSIVELRERLAIQKKFFDEWEISKREENKIKNEEKVDILAMKAEKIAKFRERNRIKKHKKRIEYLEEIEHKKELWQEKHELNVLEVKKKIERKKKKLKKENEEFEMKIREIKLQQQFLQLGRAEVEEKAFKQIEEGLERKIKVRQNKELLEQKFIEGIKVSFKFI